MDLNFNPFKKTTSPEVIKHESATEVITMEYPNPHNYPKEVLEIHHEFEVAADKLIQQANEILSAQPKVNEEKIKRLKMLGFTKAKEAVEGSQILASAKFSKEQIERVNYYKHRYPLNKFITEAQVMEICHKYNLVCGDINRYTGFVPETNLNEVEGFKVKEEDALDKQLDLWSERFFYHRALLEYSDRAVLKQPKESLKICAPIKDMDISEAELKDGYKLEAKHIPDPVVLQPVKGGYLVVTAWGDEANDPIIVNENFN